MHTLVYKNLIKKERLIISREKEKLNRILQGLSNVTRLPSALFIIDINEEHIAVKEARKLGIPIFALVDTNTNPDIIDFPIPGNDDAFRSVDIIISYIANSIQEGITAYKKEKEKIDSKKEEEYTSNLGNKIISKKEIKVIQGVIVKKTTRSNPIIKK